MPIHSRGGIPGAEQAGGKHGPATPTYLSLPPRISQTMASSQAFILPLNICKLHWQLGKMPPRHTAEVVSVLYGMKADWQVTMRCCDRGCI